MDTRRAPLLPNQFYHIYNRGINGQDLFIEERNYPYFLDKYSIYLFPFVETFAYCLLKNHFHLLIRVRDESVIRVHLQGKKDKMPVSWHVSNAFASLFKSYAQSINKGYERTGALFEEPFHRIEVTNNTYFSQLIWYIHFNPQKHGFTSDFKNYVHSSYHAHLVEKKTKLARTEVLDWFGGCERYADFHQLKFEDVELQKYLIEF